MTPVALPLRALAAASLLLLAACAGGVPVERQVTVAGGRFNAVQGEAAFLVRTFLPAEGGERQEVVGARCQLASSLYEAEVVTPSRVVVPNFGPQSPRITATCQAGDLVGSGSTRIVTRWQQSPWGWGPSPLYGPTPWMWGGPWGWYDPAIPVSDYPNLIVTMTRP